MPLEGALRPLHPGEKLMQCERLQLQQRQLLPLKMKIFGSTFYLLIPCSLSKSLTRGSYVHRLTDILDDKTKLCFIQLNWTYNNQLPLPHPQISGFFVFF